MRCLEEERRVVLEARRILDEEGAEPARESLNRRAGVLEELFQPRDILT